MENSNYTLWSELKKHHGHNLTVDCYKYSDKLMNIIYKMIEPNEDDRFDFEDLSMELKKK